MSSSESPGQILNLCGSKTFTMCSDISHVVLQKPWLLEAQQAPLPAEVGHLFSSTSIMYTQQQAKGFGALNLDGFCIFFLCVSKAQIDSPVNSHGFCLFRVP